MNNIWAIIGVVLTILMMFGSITLFFANFNAKVVSLEEKFSKNQENVSALVVSSKIRDDKISEFAVDIAEMRSNEKHQMEKLDSIDLKLAQTDIKSDALMDHLSKLNANMSGLDVSLKYIREKFDLQDQIILSEYIKNKNNG